MLDRAPPWLIGALLAATAIAFFARTLTFGFVDFDDTRILLGHPNLYGGPLVASLREILVGYFPREEPLLVRDVSWLLDARLWGFRNPQGYHFGNVVLHGVNTALIFGIVHRLSRQRALAVASALVFAVHPVHVEPVGWIMGRKDLLATALFLGALWAQHAALTAEGARVRRWVASLVAIGLCAAAVLAKVNMLSGFLVLWAHALLLPDLTGARRAGEGLGLRDVARGATIALPTGLLSVGLYVWYSGVIGAWGVFDGRGESVPLATHAVTLARLLPVAAAEYLGMLAGAGPYSISHQVPAVDLPISSGAWALGALLIAAYAGLTGWALRRQRALAFPLLAFAGLMLPYLNLRYIGIWVADRYLYLASVPLFVVLFVGVLALLRRAPQLRRVAVVGLAVTVLAWAGLAWMEQEAWRDNGSLWAREVSLPQPTVMAFQASARDFVKRAEVERDPAQRAALLDAAEDAITRGIAYYRGLPLQPAPGYLTSHVEQHGKLYYLRGQVSRLRGEPVERQIAAYLEARTIQPRAALTSMALAQSYFALAARAPEPQARLDQARASLSYYLEYVDAVQRDLQLMIQARMMLDQNYGSAFPELSAELAEARVRFWGG